MLGLSSGPSIKFLIDFALAGLLRVGDSELLSVASFRSLEEKDFLKSRREGFWLLSKARLIAGVPASFIVKERPEKDFLNGALGPCRFFPENDLRMLGLISDLPEGDFFSKDAPMSASSALFCSSPRFFADSALRSDGFDDSGFF